MSNRQQSQADIPDGHVPIQGDNGQHYLATFFDSGYPSGNGSALQEA